MWKSRGCCYYSICDKSLQSSFQFPVLTDTPKSNTVEAFGGRREVVTAVQVRVPSSLPPSEGVLRLHSTKDCHPFTEQQIEDEKCPQNCGAGKCLEIPFRLASSIRQILLITDQTHYKRTDVGMYHFHDRIQFPKSKQSFSSVYNFHQYWNFCALKTAACFQFHPK